eukprot:COSAG02_NODE_520_length_20751_cov_17.817112_2_plen_149_part_00
MELDEDLLVRSVKRGGPADAQGITQGMRLVSINGYSLLGETLEDTKMKLDGTAKPWQLVLERMAGKEDTGRTLFQLVQQIKKDVSSPPISLASQLHVSLTSRRRPHVDITFLLTALRDRMTDDVVGTRREFISRFSSRYRMFRAAHGQ